MNRLGRFINRLVFSALANAVHSRFKPRAVCTEIVIRIRVSRTGKTEFYPVDISDPVLYAGGQIRVDGIFEGSDPEHFGTVIEKRSRGTQNDIVNPAQIVSAQLSVCRIRSYHIKRDRVVKRHTEFLAVILFVFNKSRIKSVIDRYFVTAQFAFVAAPIAR